MLKDKLRNAAKGLFTPRRLFIGALGVAPVAARVMAVSLSLSASWLGAGAVVLAFAAMLVIHSVLFQPFTIPSSSMEPDLVTGDYIVVSKFAYGWSRASLPLNPPLSLISMNV